MQVKTVIVCGHYGCGAVKAALKLPSKTCGLVNCWISDIRECRNQHEAELRSVDDFDLMFKRCLPGWWVFSIFIWTPRRAGYPTFLKFKFWIHGVGRHRTGTEGSTASCELLCGCLITPGPRTPTPLAHAL